MSRSRRHLKRLGMSFRLDTRNDMSRCEGFQLKNGERRYDSKAILGVAYGIQHPKEGPLSAADFSGGERTVTRQLDSLGFDIVAIQDGEEIPLRTYTAQKMTKALEAEWANAERNRDFDPTSIEDARLRIRGTIKAYGGRCAMSDCDCEDALEAAHIHPYRGEETDYVPTRVSLDRPD
jgi:hypothetical protein